MTPIRVMLVDDHRVVSQGLEVLLGSFAEVEVVGVASAAVDAIAMYAECRPDVVLMDLSMPGMRGIEATHKLRDIDPDARVIVLSGFVAEDLVDDVIGAGACGYLLKSIAGGDLVDAIIAAAGGRATFSNEALSMLPNRATPPRLGRDLTPRELDVLEALVHGESNKEIAKNLSLSAGTVRVHVSNILSKLDVENRTAAAFVAQQHRLVGSPRPGFSAPT